MEKTVVQTNNKYAIVINTYDRPFSLLNQTVNYYEQNCGSMSYGGLMSHIFIICGEIDKTPTSSDAF